MEPVFSEFGKISRLNRDIVITEKIDGTNAAVGVTDEGLVYAQSRSRIITPQNDNFGFARWVEKNAEALKLLGPGLHFGEWWGVGIQRGYDLSKRIFSLFNTARWKNSAEVTAIKDRGVDIDVVPVLYEGPWMTGDGVTNPIYQRFAPTLFLNDLRTGGSHAMPGYMKPEGIVVYHKASRSLFKATCENDEKPKSQDPKTLVPLMYGTVHANIAFKTS